MRFKAIQNNNKHFFMSINVKKTHKTHTKDNQNPHGLSLKSV